MVWPSSQPGDLPAAPEAHHHTHEPGGNDPLDATYSTISALGKTLRQALYGAASGVTISGLMTDIETESITTTGGQVIVLGWGKASATTNAVGGIVRSQFALQRDTTDLVTPDTIDLEKSAASNGNFGYPTQPFVYIDNAVVGVPGTYVYKVRGLISGIGVTLTSPIGEGGLVLVELST